jgi:hypothetical protein
VSTLNASGYFRIHDAFELTERFEKRGDWGCLPPRLIKRHYIFTSLYTQYISIYTMPWNFEVNAIVPRLTTLSSSLGYHVAYPIKLEILSFSSNEVKTKSLGAGAHKIERKRRKRGGWGGLPPRLIKRHYTFTSLPTLSRIPRELSYQARNTELFLERSEDRGFGGWRP